MKNHSFQLKSVNIFRCLYIDTLSYPKFIIGIEKKLQRQKKSFLQEDGVKPVENMICSLKN